MNKTKPTLSIIMTTYNGEEFLSEQIESILNQSYQNFELMIYDDNSEDNTVKIIEIYIKHYDCIKLYQNKKNIGFVKNFENALQKCDSNYIALADQDDIWLKDKLEIELKLLQSHERKDEPILVHSDLEMVNARTNSLHSSFFKYRHIEFPESNSLSRVISHNGVMGNTILMNRSLVTLALPFPDKLKYHDYWLAIISEIYGKRITCQKALVQYRIHEHNASNSTALLSIQRKNALPFCHINNEHVLKYLLENYEVDVKSRKIIESFIMYLENNTYWFIQIYNLVHYNIIRKDKWYRIKLFSKIFLRSILKGFK